MTPTNGRSSQPTDDSWTDWVSTAQEIVSEWERTNGLPYTHTRATADLVERFARALERANRLGRARSDGSPS